jgi:outer membrane protein OmpA-like peptidoglycan-associated protein
MIPSSINAAALVLVLTLPACGENSSDYASRNAETADDETSAQADPQSQDPSGDRSPRPESNLSASTSSRTAASSELNSRIVGMNRIVELPSDVLFAFDSADLRPEAVASLREVADEIRGAPAGAIVIVGHTDSKGSDTYNLDLSTRRAQAVRDWMGEQVGVRQRDFEVSGAGEGDPVMPNVNPDGSDSEEGRSRNRRVEVVIPLE